MRSETISTRRIAADTVDWVITNPPFRLAEDFVHRSLVVARQGVAVLVRTVFIESVVGTEVCLRKRRRQSAPGLPSAFLWFAVGWIVRRQPQRVTLGSFGKSRRRRRQESRVDCRLRKKFERDTDYARL